MAISNGVAADAVNFYARWWQFEAWLRTITYLELRTALGSEWHRILPAQAKGRSERDDENAYRASPDSTNPLAYLDSHQLFDLISDPKYWPYFEPSLLPRRRWALVADDLLSLRNRNAHYRRPHKDDLARLEQALRDLEAGARRSLSSFANDDWPTADGEDASLHRWLRDSGSEDSLIEHAMNSYDTDFSLRYSRRPWSATSVHRVSGATGLLWKANWVTRGRYVPPAALWDDLRHIAELLVFVTHEEANMVTVTFSAVDSPDSIATAIGAAFHSVLRNCRLYEDDWESRWLKGIEVPIDYRVQVCTPLAMAWVLRDSPAESVFGISS